MLIGTDDKSKALYHLIRPLPKGSYTVDIRLEYLQDWILNQERDMLAVGGSFELCPDFQRGHVWNEKQQIAYCEALLGDKAPRNILFNCPNWQTNELHGDINPQTMQCIDGLQRLTAVLRFVNNEIKVFGEFVASDFDGTAFDIRRFRLTLTVYEYKHRNELLQFYVDLNSAGTAHTEEELQRVKDLMKQ